MEDNKDKMEDNKDTIKSTVTSISEIDKSKLALSTMNRKLALANAQRVLAEQENAELAYKYLVVQLYMKYGLSADHVITDNGDIILKTEVKDEA